MKPNNSFELVENPVTEFHEAARNGNLIRLVKLLDEDGVDINATNADGNSSLNLAAGNNHPEIVSELMGRKADPTIENNLKSNAVRMGVSGNLENLTDLLAYTQKYRLLHGKRPSSTTSPTSIKKGKESSRITCCIS